MGAHRIVIARPAQLAANLPPGRVGTDGPDDTWRRLDVLGPGGAVVSQLTLIPLATLTFAGGTARVCEARLEGDPAPFAEWWAGLPWKGTLQEFRALFAEQSTRGAALRAAWPADERHRRWCVPPDVRPEYDAAGQLANTPSGPSGAPRFPVRLGLRQADYDDSAPVAEADEA